MKKIPVEISKEADDELHRNHFVYGVIMASDGLKFLTAEEQLDKKLLKERLR